MLGYAVRGRDAPVRTGASTLSEDMLAA